jgi:hypothetical protein
MKKRKKRHNEGNKSTKIRQENTGKKANNIYIYVYEGKSQSFYANFNASNYSIKTRQAGTLPT